MTLPLLIVDAANVVGSVPDGWWRDRRAAAERLRDHLARYAADGVPGLLPGPRVVAAPGEGDDTIAGLARAAAGRRCVVVTADRELRRRVGEYGAECAGPRTVRPA
jgi:hypothetical protein